MIIITMLMVLFVIIIVFFNVPYSQTRYEARAAVNSLISGMGKSTGVFTPEDIAGLPSPMQQHFEYCGLLGTPKMTYMKADFKNVDFKMSADKTIKIDYTQYNFVEKPQRLAFIDSSLYGIPFEGLDSYQNGTGSMKGRLAKLITLFDQRGPDMNKACLVTILAECIFVPSIALQDYITWEAIDETHAKATISYYGISAGGVFTIDQSGAVISFKTKDRVATGLDGSKREAEWSAVILDYQTINGIKAPKTVQSIWHYPEGDRIYFNENRQNVLIQYYY